MDFVGNVSAHTDLKQEVVDKPLFKMVKFMDRSDDQQCSFRFYFNDIIKVFVENNHRFLPDSLSFHDLITPDGLRSEV